jgi:hypothetical protein
MKENMMSFRDPTTQDEQKVPTFDYKIFFFQKTLSFQYTGTFADYEYMKSWLTDKCIPLVREVTFENVEELTEEGLPFLILFRDPNDKETEKKYTETVRIVRCT